MHQPHTTYWLIGLFVLFMLIFAVGSIRLGRIKPKAGQTLVYLPAVLAVACLLLAFGLRGNDVSRLRQEFQEISPANITSIQLEQEGVAFSLTNSAKISGLLTGAQKLVRVSAHHSFPINPVTISFAIGDGRYKYKIGKDSQNPTEFWVVWHDSDANAGSAIEIGRFNSTNFEQLVKQAMADAK